MARLEINSIVPSTSQEVLKILEVFVLIYCVMTKVSFLFKTRLDISSLYRTNIRKRQETLASVSF